MNDKASQTDKQETQAQDGIRREIERAFTVPATVENLQEINAFIAGVLEPEGIVPKAALQLEIAVEEIFVNIASYAYEGKPGTATVRIRLKEGDPRAQLSFIDTGIAYNPLARPDPDTAASLEARQIGGLGIFLVKKNVDDIRYERKDGKNILTIWKNLAATPPTDAPIEPT